jgi:cytochrome c biogenesis protein CcmG, thiol:disulfide interchange protein DsbE
MSTERRTTIFRRAQILVSVFLAGGICALSSCYGGSRPPRIGRSALDFTIQDSDRKVSLRDFRGQVVVVNFWASYCPPCIAETPSMQKRFKDKGLVVVGISADVDEAAYYAFLKKYDITFLTVRDPEAKVQHQYGTPQIPESYVIDAQGVLRRKIVNAIDWESPEITTFLLRTAGEGSRREDHRRMVRPERFELPTCCSGGNRSIQLSYGRRPLFPALYAIFSTFHSGSKLSSRSKLLDPASIESVSS